MIACEMKMVTVDMRQAVFSLSCCDVLEVEKDPNRSTMSPILASTTTRDPANTLVSLITS